MSTTAAASLARLRVVYGATWRITKDETGRPVFVAVHRTSGRRLTAATVAGLGALLAGEAR